MTTYNQQRSEDCKAELDSTIVEFYDRCRKSADKSTPWHMLHPHVQMQFTQAVAFIHSVVYNQSQHS